MNGDVDARAALRDEMLAARDGFVEALDDVEPELLETPGLVGEWSARELIAHLGYWAGVAAEAIHAAEQGRVDQFDADPADVDERNATVARVARHTDVQTVMRREEAAFDALLERVQRVDRQLLETTLNDGRSLEAEIREESVEHYKEHTQDVRAWWAGGEPDDDAALEDLAELDGANGGQ